MVPAALALLPVAVGFATLSHASPEAFTDKHGWKLVRIMCAVLAQ